MQIVFVVLVLMAIPFVFIALIALIYGSKENLRKKYTFQPTVTIFLPTCNEEKYIKTKLENLLGQTYPVIEILVYDCSADNTPKIVKEYQRRNSFIKLIRQQKRIGNAQTLNQALKEARGEIIVKTDCDALAKSKGALKELVSNFADPKIGGVCGIYTSQEGIEKYFRKFMTRLQVAETNLDSTIIAHACFLAFRKIATSPVNPNSMCEDAEEFILIRKNGYRTIVDTEVINEEEVPKTFKKRRTQKDRRAQGIIKALIENKDILFNPRFGRYGLIIYPINLFLLTISPIIIPVFAVLLLYTLYMSNPLYLIACIALITLAFTIKRNIPLAIIDTQISALIATINTFLGREKGPTWKRIR